MIEAVKELIPKEVIYRRKMGFCGSATNMVTDRVGQWAQEAIMDSRLTAELFDRDYIDGLLQRHSSQKRFNSFKVWNLLNLVIWYEHWFENSKSIADS